MATGCADCNERTRPSRGRKSSKTLASRSRWTGEHFHHLTFVKRTGLKRRGSQTTGHLAAHTSMRNHRNWLLVRGRGACRSYALKAGLYETVVSEFGPSLNRRTAERESLVASARDACGGRAR